MSALATKGDVAALELRVRRLERALEHLVTNLPSAIERDRIAHKEAADKEAQAMTSKRKRGE